VIRCPLEGWHGSAKLASGDDTRENRFSVTTLDPTFLDTHLEPVANLAYPITRVRFELEQADKVICEGAAGFVDVIRDARITVPQNDRCREYGVRTRITGVRQAIRVGVGEESDEDGVVIRCAKGVRRIIPGRIVRIVVEDAGLICVGIPYVGSADEGQEALSPEHVVKTSSLSVEDKCVRVRVAESRNQVDVAPGLDRANWILHRIGVQVSGQKYECARSLRGVFRQPLDESSSSASPRHIALALSVARVRIADSVAVRTLGFEMVYDDGHDLVCGVGLESLGQARTVAAIIEIRVGPAVENRGKPDRRDHVAAVHDSDRDRVATETGFCRLDGSVGSARRTIVQCPNELAECALGSGSVVFDLDQRHDVGIESNEGFR
jgi:hypothetical protein